MQSTSQRTFCRISKTACLDADRAARLLQMITANNDYFSHAHAGMPTESHVPISWVLELGGAKLGRLSDM